MGTIARLELWLATKQVDACSRAGTANILAEQLTTSNGLRLISISQLLFAGM